ncbi:MAG: class I SAM-dependent methyltransferase family protein [Candidatus Dormibacteria bacterium]
MAGEWIEWHRQYDQPQGALVARLQMVQQRIRGTLDELPPGEVRVISMCAGDGRDLLGALRDHPRRDDVRGRLAELDPELVRRGRRRVRRAGLLGIEFALGDAAASAVYAEMAPAHLLLVCGVFGNISAADIRRTIAFLPQLCAPQGTVIWTRGRFKPDLTPTIRRWFAESGFRELSFTAIPDSTACVGSHRLAKAPLASGVDRHLFTFQPKAVRDRRHQQRTPPLPGSSG